MTSFDNLAIEELNTLTYARKMMAMKICLGNNYKVYSQQSLYPNIHSKPIPGHKKCTPIYTPKPAAYLYFKTSSKT